MNGTATSPVRGRVLYDGDCTFCRRWVARFEPFLRRRGFALETLQAAGGSLEELRCELADGRSFGGADALLAIAEQVWWGRPLAWLGRRRWLRPGLRAAYRWVAARRHCRAARCDVPRR